MKTSTTFLIIALALMAALKAIAQPKTGQRFSGFPVYAEFLNTDVNPRESPTYSDRLLILNFYTPESRICQGEIDRLSKLASRYRFAKLIGVYSPKYPNDTLRGQAIHSVIRQQINYPVILDKHFVMWSELNINQWPTTVLTGKGGEVLASHSGPGASTIISATIDSLSQTGYTKKLRTSPATHKTARRKRPSPIPGYPAHIIADAPNLRLFFSEPTYNRVTILDQAGIVLNSIGSTKPGNSDGHFNTARFNAPTGVAYDSLNNLLYIADTRNNLIRVANLDSEKVKTVLGNGQRAMGKAAAANGTSDPINLPTGLLYRNRQLYICMSGRNEVWKYNPQTALARRIAGHFQMGFTNGSTNEALMAQPEDLAMDEFGTLYICDSENNAIRALRDSQLTTLAGGKGPFDFGDETGKARKTRFQVPSGLAMSSDGGVVVADRYNHRLKKIRSNGNRVDNLIGTGKPGLWLGPAFEAVMNQPTDMAYMRGKWYITDSNNGMIRVYNPKENTLGALRLMGLQNLSTPEGDHKEQMIRAGELALNPDNNELKIKINLPEGYRFTSRAPNFALLKTKAQNSHIDFSKLPQGVITINTNQSNEKSKYIIVDLLAYIHPKELPEKQEALHRTILINTTVEKDAVRQHLRTVDIPEFR